MSRHRTTKRKLSEAEAWHFVAKAWERHAGTYYQHRWFSHTSIWMRLPRDQRCSAGLCATIERMDEKNLITARMRTRMLSRLRDTLAGSKSLHDYLWPVNHWHSESKTPMENAMESASARIIAATLLHLLAKEGQ